MNDKQFTTIFLGVMGVLTIIFFVIFFIAQIIVPETNVADEFTNNAVVSRIEPVGKLNYSDSNEQEAKTTGNLVKVDLYGKLTLKDECLLGICIYKLYKRIIL